MATKNINLGTVPVSRGEFNSTTIYYKDNIVQYKRGSYQVISESPIVGIPPINNEDIVNNGWIIFAGTLSEASLIKSNTQNLSGKNVQENLNSAAEKLKELEAEIIYDVTVNNDGATFASLSALLSDENLSTLIPSEVRCGGMSIRFIQSSDNKYVQYRLMKNTWSTIVSDWQGVDDGPTFGSENLVKSGGIYSMYQEVSGAEIVFPSDTSSYHSYPISVEANKTYLIKNTTGHNCRLVDFDDASVFTIPGDWTDYHKVVFTQEQANTIIKVRSIYGDGSVNIKMKTLSERIDENKQAIDKNSDILVPIKIGKNLITDIEKGKYINSTGQISNFDDSIGITNKIYLNGNKKLYNNAFVKDRGFKNALFAEDDSVVAVLNDNLIDATNYPTAVYARCTISISDRNTPVRQQIVYGDKSQPYSPISPIQGMQIEYVNVTCNSDVNSGADFVGNTAVRDAIAKITDASYFKRYILKCTGTFKAVKPTDYQLGPDNTSSQYALFWLKDYIYIDGIERNNCIFYSSLPDTIAECQLNDSTFGTTGNTYGEYQPLFLSVYPSVIKNATFIAHNTRYPLHICNGNPQPQQGETIIVENCNLIHEGKHGDSIETTGGSASGFGSADGATYIFKNILFKSTGKKGLYFHDGKNYKSGVSFVFEDCVVTGYSSIINIENFSNSVGSKLTIKNTKFDKTGFIEFRDLGNSNEDNYADTCKVDANFDFNARPLNISGGYALRIETLADNSTVRFNPSSNAFDIIVGNSADTILQLANKYNRCQQYGYQWRDGGENLKGEAIGFINIDENKNLNLGTRLGDCSSSNKTLDIIINDTTYTVTFNKDYTSASNADIIAEINTIIGTVATASVYHVNEDWYPNFKGLKWTTVDDSGSINRGMGVVYTETGIRKAKSTDGYIDGIAVDSGVNGSQIRIITRGIINFEYYVHPLLTTAEHYYNVPYNTGYAIGTNDGEFIRSENNVVLRKSLGDSIRFI